MFLGGFGKNSNLFKGGIHEGFALTPIQRKTDKVMDRAIFVVTLGFQCFSVLVF